MADRRDAATAALLVLLAGALYARTACPTLAGGDSAELAAAAAVLGVPHPPGYPLWTVATGLLVRLLPADDLAGAANLASGVWAALAVGGLHLFLRGLPLGRAAAATAAAALACGSTFWAQATVAEVYTFDVLLAVLALLAVQRACRLDGPRAWLAAGVVVGLWVGHRPLNALLCVGPLAALVLLRGDRLVLPRLARAAVGAALSLAVYAWLPLASLRDPALDVGDPETWERFLAVVTLEPYRRHLGDDWGRHFGRLARFAASLHRELGGALALAAVGLAARPPRARALRLALALWIGTAAFFAMRYEVLDVEVFFLPAVLGLAVLAGCGADAVARRLPPRAAALLPALAALPALAWNGAERDRSADRLTRRAAEDVLASLPDRSLLFVQGDTSAHALWFLQGVEGARPDVAVVSLGHARAWYAEQLAARHPDDPWPAWRPGEPPSRWGRRVLDALGPLGSDGRPACHGLSVDGGALLFVEAGGPRYDTVPRGLAREIHAGARVDVRALSTFNASFFDAAWERLQPVPHDVDMDSKSTLQQYALALYQAAGFMERVDLLDEARTAYERVLALEPDRHEADVRADVQRGLGFAPPRLGLEALARARLAALGSG